MTSFIPKRIADQLMKSVTTTTRLISRHQEQGHFCHCGAPATNSCTDSKQVGDEWIESAERYGCDSHRAESAIDFADGTTVTESQYEGTKCQ
jgi:hypothetical protein